jgi:hypothetical protein
LGLCALAVACDASGIHPLGRLRDTLVPCVGDPAGHSVTTSTWLRSTPEGTEIVLLGRPDPTDVVLAERPACYGHGFVAHDSSTTFEFGSYTLDEEGKGVALHSVEYVFAYQIDRSVLSRDGSIRTDLGNAIQEILSISKDGDDVILSLDGAPMRMRSVGALVEALDVTTQEGADNVFRLYNLPLFTSQARLLGFGSGSMTQYVDTTAEFRGAVRNRFTVSVESFLDPNTHISYYQLEDLSGIVIDGLQHTYVDTGGDGHMGGTLSFLMSDARSSTGAEIRGRLDYSTLEIDNGVAAGGTYTLTIDGVGDPYIISYKLAADIDLRTVLPVQSP